MKRMLLVILSLCVAVAYTSVTSAMVASILPVAPYSGDIRANPEEDLHALLARLSLEQKVGQLFMPAADGDVYNLVQTYHLGGVILFSRHLPSREEAVLRITAAQNGSPMLPLLVAVDQEGGKVSRLSFGTTLPPARQFSALDPDALWRTGRLVGDELRSLGFNVNFAPVLDVDTSEENPVIGSRSFSSNPETVSRLGVAYIRGLHGSGIAAAAKHFPGHGDTRTDSHFVLPVVSQPLARLHEVEIAPFREAIRAGVDFIMVAHVNYPALDPSPERPASLSPVIISGLLRNELAFTGLIITDALNMKAITDSHDAGQAALAAFRAGSDILLMPADLPTAYHAILTSVRTADIPESRLNESVLRILRLKQKLQAYDLQQHNRPQPDIVGSPFHRQKMDQILSTFESPYEMKR